MEYYRQIDSIVQNMAKQINIYGIEAVKAGNNGPYYDIETNIRNLSHWCVIFSEYYLHTKNPIYKKYSEMLADEIILSKYYNNNGVYKCREGIGKDEINGVIGPAWIIEGLIAAAEATGQIKYYDRAKFIFDAHKFNYKLGLWNRINYKGEILSIDATFNHQLWFAAAGALINNLKEDKKIQYTVNRFIEKLPGNITIRKNGRIGHFTYSDKNGLLNKSVLLYKNLKSSAGEITKSKSLAYKENGYHTFNLLGMALLQDNIVYKIPFFDTSHFKKCIEYALSDEFYISLCNADRTKDSTNISSRLNVTFNVFSFAYNSPAFELPRAIKCFCNGKNNYQKILKNLMEKQMALTYDNDKHMLSNNTDDPWTLTARLYEYIYKNKEFWDQKKETGDQI